MIVYARVIYLIIPMLQIRIELKSYTINWL